MKDENKNIDTFFSTRLQNESVGEDEWNIPSDEIWNAAKSKFVDRKKTKRRFMFWLLIPLLALCLSIPLKILEGDEMQHQIDTVSHLENDSNAENVLVKQNTTSLSKNEIIGTTESLTSIQNENKKPNQNKISGKTHSKVLDVQIINNTTLKNKNEDQVVESQFVTETTKEQGIIRTENNKVNDVNDVMDVIYTKDSNEASKANNANSAKSKNEVSKTERQKLLIPFLNNINVSKNIDTNLNLISQAKLLKYKEENNFEIAKYIVPLAGPPFRNEVGVSHSQLLLNLFLAYGLEEDDSVDQFTFSTNYFNANATGRKWLNRRWSFMSGLQYSKLDLGLNFSVIDTLDKELMEFINEEFSAIKNRSSITEQETDVEINLKEGIDTQLGDLLNIQGDIQLNITAVQIPFFLDYHIYKRKFEYIFGMGVTLEYLTVSELVSNIEIYKTNQLISKPAQVPEFKDEYIDGSIYLKSGMRYLISDQIHFGLDAKINLLGLPFSGVDAGFYYRWN